MSDRSDELTERRNRDVPATDDPLEETDRLLSEPDATAGNGSPESVDVSSSAPSDNTQHESHSDSSRSRLSALTARLSLGRYFSPKEFVVVVALLGAGLLAGATVLPIAGRLIGMFVVAFAIGLLTSKRRYLEMTAAGVSVGAVASVLNNVILTVAGSGQALVAVGATFGLLATVCGYYFGRDLRDGLSRDLE